MRENTIKRSTSETDIKLSLNLDDKKTSTIDTGIGFFDHMLNLFAFHSQITLNITCKGDTDIDDHHTVEDIGIALGKSIAEALGDKVGIKRYGVSYVPMDEALSRAVLDISNRGYLIFSADFKRPMIGAMALENVKEFFQAFAMNAGVTLHLENFYGENDHHKVESLFKAFGQAFRQAITIVSSELPSTKGVL